MKNLILCISFGHESAQIGDALRGAVAYSREYKNAEVLVADDCSGNPPSAPEGVRVLNVPSRRGYAGVVSYVLDLYPEASGRLLLINPDASLEKDGVALLLEFAGGIAVPRVLNPAGELENVRRATTASEQLLALVFGEQMARKSVQQLSADTAVVDCPPYAPSGSVLSMPLDFLRAVPLRSEFFWLEQSDWIYRYANTNGSVQVSILPITASHTGASTSLRYPVSVAASQLRAKINFVNEYGNLLHRSFLPVGILMKAVRFGLNTRSLWNGMFLLKVGTGVADWRVSK